MWPRYYKPWIPGIRLYTRIDEPLYHFIKTMKSICLIHYMELTYIKE
jgi:hypothetical protein